GSYITCSQQQHLAREREERKRRKRRGQRDAQTQLAILHTSFLQIGCVTCKKKKKKKKKKSAQTQRSKAGRIKSTTHAGSQRASAELVTLLVICALAFLVCVVFLVVYKIYQYEQPCPDSLVYMQGRCMPTGLYGSYPPQGPGGRGRLFTYINHYNMAKQTITRSVSPWVTIMSEEKVTQQETETAQKLA
uniref:Neuronal vesicle trafficking-associated protein 1 n=1 Tax=Nothobranchius furzeri TaxID=105023 RepID=A0A8C6LWF3_NOTFU